MYLHSSKEYSYESGEEIGLDEDALDEFMYALYEVGFELEVEMDGSYKIVAVDGDNFELK